MEEPKNNAKTREDLESQLETIKAIAEDSQYLKDNLKAMKDTATLDDATSECAGDKMCELLSFLGKKAGETLEQVDPAFEAKVALLNRQSNKLKSKPSHGPKLK